jgi:hypothetical protein
MIRRTTGCRRRGSRAPERRDLTAKRKPYGSLGEAGQAGSQPGRHRSDKLPLRSEETSMVGVGLYSQVGYRVVHGEGDAVK